MDEQVLDEMEIAPPSVVKQAARDFAAALSETPQFKTFDEAAECLRLDQDAQQALAAYQEKQIAWRALMMLNALSEEQKAELNELREAIMNRPALQEYYRAQTEFMSICQSLGDTLSESIGLNYAASCGVSCCG